ncbi:UNVERIFIED_CONTAM: hypothetical protein FKN15_002403 [Acipenser sinensis]
MSEIELVLARVVWPPEQELPTPEPELSASTARRRGAGAASAYPRAREGAAAYQRAREAGAVCPGTRERETAGYSKGGGGKLVNKKHFLKYRYYAALKTMEQLENIYIPRVSKYRFCQIMAETLPKLREEIKEISMSDLKDFLESIRKHSDKIGETAMKQTHPIYYIDCNYQHPPDAWIMRQTASKDTPPATNHMIL